jgi:hypothetical protein
MVGRFSVRISWRTRATTAALLLSGGLSFLAVPASGQVAPSQSVRPEIEGGGDRAPPAGGNVPLNGEMDPVAEAEIRGAGENDNIIVEAAKAGRVTEETRREAAKPELNELQKRMKNWRPTEPTN